jgi:hypothetical protein
MTQSPENLITEFVTWLSKSKIVLAGPVPDEFLGTSVLRPLDSQDLPTVVSDFLQQRTKV